MDFDDFFSSASFLYQQFDASIVYNVPATVQSVANQHLGKTVWREVTLFYNNKIIFFSIFYIYSAKVYKEPPSGEVSA
jgi:hypothetical protein